MADTFPCPSCKTLLSVSAAKEINGTRSIRCPKCYLSVPIRAMSSSAPQVAAGSKVAGTAAHVPPTGPVSAPPGPVVQQARSSPPPPPPAYAPQAKSTPAMEAKPPAAYQPPVAYPPQDKTGDSSLPPTPTVRQVGPRRRFRVIGIAVCGLLLLGVGAAGLSGILSGKANPPRQIAATSGTLRSNASTETPNVAANVAASPKVNPDSKTDPSKIIRGDLNQLADISQPGNQKVPVELLPKSKPSSKPIGILPKKPRSRGALVTAQLSSLDALFIRLKVLSQVLGNKFELMSTVNMLQAGFNQLAVVGSQRCGAFLQQNEAETSWALVLVVPVQGEQPFRQMLAEAGFVESRKSGDIMELNTPVIPASLSIPLPPQCYLRFVEKGAYAYICVGGDANLIAGSDVLTLEQIFDDREKRLLTATVHLDQLPSLVHNQWNSQRGELESKIQAVDEATAKYGAEFLRILTQLTDDVLDGKHKLRLSLNAELTGFTADLEMHAEPGSNLAQSIASLGDTPSRFGELDFNETAFGARVNMRLPESLRALLPDVIRTATRQALADDLGDPAAKIMAEGLFNALGPTVGAGELDAVVAIFSNGSGKPACSINAVKIVDGEAFDRFIQETVKNPDPSQVGIVKLIQLNAETIGGVSAHKVSSQSLPPEVNAVMGNEPVYWAFGTNMLGNCMGLGGKAKLAQLLEAKPKKSPLAELSLNLKQTQELIDGKIEFPEGDKVLNLLSNSDPGRVKLRLEANKGQLQLRLSLSPLVFRAAIERIPIGIQIPTGVKIPAGVQIPSGIQIPVPSGIQIPTRIQIPKGLQIPLGVQLAPSEAN